MKRKTNMKRKTGKCYIKSAGPRAPGRAGKRGRSSVILPRPCDLLGEGPAKCKMKSISRGFAPLHGGILTSSIWQESDATRLVFITMLAMKDADGKVSAAVPGLAHIARVSIEDTRKALKILESPDPESRTEANEGRRIKKVDGGWLVLGHFKYRDLMRSGKPTRTSSPNGTTPLQNKDKLKPEDENRTKANTNTNTHRVNDPIRVNDQVNDQVSRYPNWVNEVEKVNIETFSTDEQNALMGLTAERQRTAFLLIRAWAARAADAGEPDFAVSRKYLMEKLHCTGPNVTDILRRFRDDGILEQTKTHDHREGKSARYRWAIETTLSIPAMDQDQPIEGIPTLEEGEEALEL
jgi:hypothetical protein